MGNLRVPLSEMCARIWGDTWKAPLFMASPQKTLGYYYGHDYCCGWFCCASSGCCFCYYYTLWPLPALQLYFLSDFPIQCNPGLDTDLELFPKLEKQALRSVEFRKIHPIIFK